MKASVSFNVGSKSSLSHNNRENLHGNPDIDISKTKDNIYYIQRDIREVYDEEFKSSVEEYNNSQKREDRKIKDYYSKVLNDKKTEHQREIIVAVGRYNDNIPNEIKKEILDKYMQSFQERNKSLKVYNAVMHLDEQNPHLHINYVPVATYNKGLKKRVSQKKVVKELGFDSFEDWRKSETGLIEQLMAEKGIERQEVGSHKYLNVKEYKEYKDNIKALESKLEALKSDLKAFESVESSFDKIDSIKAKKSHLGAKISIKEDDYKLMVDLSKKSLVLSPKVTALQGKVSFLENQLYEKTLNLDERMELYKLRNENVNLKSSIVKQNKYIATLENKLIDNGLAVRKPKKEIKIQKNKLKSHEIGD